MPKMRASTPTRYPNEVNMNEDLIELEAIYPRHKNNQPFAGLEMLGYRGSQAHGTCIPPERPDCIDDVDVMGVHIAPPECYIGLEEWGMKGTKETKVGKWDVVAYEITKFVRLLLKGNPNVMGMLWLRERDYLYLGELGRRLIRERKIFVGRHVFYAFHGYASSQLKRMQSLDPKVLEEYLEVEDAMRERGLHPSQDADAVGTDLLGTIGDPSKFAMVGNEELMRKWKDYHAKGLNLGYLGEKRKRLVLKCGYDCKNAAHTLRLLRMCVEFLLTGEMFVDREGLDAEELLEIKLGRAEKEWVMKEIERQFELAETAFNNSKLPPQADWAAAGALMAEEMRKILLRGGAKQF